MTDIAKDSTGFQQVIPDKTVRINGKYHRIFKIETAINGGNVKDLVDKACDEYIKKYFPDKLQ